MKISHCSECGTPYEDVENWPRVCGGCNTERWLNPVPVVAVMQPVLTARGNIGLVIAKRAIEPCRGQWALIGSFMNVDETVEEAAAREFREETSIDIAGTPQIVFTLPVGGRVRSQLMLMTCVDTLLPYEVFRKARPCPENEEIGLFYADDDRELAFPTHRDAVKKFFSGEYGWPR